jgi:hypothetical protein
MLTQQSSVNQMDVAVCAVGIPTKMVRLNLLSVTKHLGGKYKAVTELPCRCKSDLLTS